jgi:putative ABC transport system ATP-binding protein
LRCRSSSSTATTRLTLRAPLAEVGPRIARRISGQLSGGEQQRVAMARALAPKPPYSRRRADRQSDETTGAEIMDLCSR